MARNSNLIPVTFYLDAETARMLASRQVEQSGPRQTRRTAKSASKKTTEQNFFTELRDMILEKKLVGNNAGGIKLASRLTNSLERLGVYNLKALATLEPMELADTEGFGRGQAKLLAALQRAVSDKRSSVQQSPPAQ